MQLHQTLHDIESGNALKSTGFRIDLNEKTVQLLNDPYTDKPLAVLRELSCNALDATKAAGSDEPIRVHLPNALEPWFTVSDNGTGIGPEQMQEAYTGYGVSSKDNSNDYIGAFGIGRFSALAYGESFSVIDRHKPTSSKCFYTITKDERGIPVLLLNQRVALQPHETSGFEVKVPVRKEDYPRFKEAAESFFVHVTPTPIITGNKVDLTPPEVLLQAPHGRWRILKRKSDYEQAQNKAVMGPVRYLVDPDKLPDLKNQRYALAQLNLELMLNMGEVSTAISREALSYNQLTIKALTKAYKEFIADLKATVEDKIATATTMYEARCRYTEAIAHNNYAMNTLVGDKFTWNGKEVDNSSYKLDAPNHEFAVISKYKLSRDRLPIVYAPNITLGGDPSKQTFVVDDLDTVKPRPAIRDVIKLNYSGGHNDIIIIKTKPGGNVADAIAAAGNPPVDYLSKVTHPERLGGSFSTRAPKRPVKMKVWNPTTAGWVEATRALDDGGLYVPLHGTVTKSRFSDSINDVREALESLTGETKVDLYGIPATVCSEDDMKGTKGWELWDDAAVNRVIKYINDNEVKKYWTSYLTYRHVVDQTLVAIACNYTRQELDLIKARSPFRKMGDMALTFRQLKLTTLHALTNILKMDMAPYSKKEPIVDFKELATKVRNTCPLLISVGTYDAKKSEYATHVINYINSNS